MEPYPARRPHHHPAALAQALTAIADHLSARAASAPVLVAIDDVQRGTRDLINGRAIRHALVTIFEQATAADLIMLAAPRG